MWKCGFCEFRLISIFREDSGRICKKKLDGQGYFQYNRYDVLLCRDIVKEVFPDENDVSAEKETKSKGSWFQSENEFCGRKESISCQKSKGKKRIICLGRNLVAFCFLPVRD